jgi:hypothetical protein
MPTTKMRNVSTPHQEKYQTEDGNVTVTNFKRGAWQVMPRGHAPFTVGSKAEAFKQAIGISSRHWGMPKAQAFPGRARQHAVKKSGKKSGETYTVHGHVRRRDGRQEAFWTRTGLTKSEANRLAREQRAESGGVAEVVREEGPAYRAIAHATKKPPAQLDREIGEALAGASGAHSLYKELVAAGVPIDHHESDLYVLDTRVARGILAAHGKKGTAFTSQVDGRRWIDVPFAYEPFWEKASRAARR